MVKKMYGFAGVAFEIEMPEEMIFTEARRLAPFRADYRDEYHAFCFEKKEKLSEPMGTQTLAMDNLQIFQSGDITQRYIGAGVDDRKTAYACVITQGKKHSVELLRSNFRGRIGTKTVLECIAAEHLIARNDGFVFHCSYIDHNGKAILFTAPSETGKSTQAELWHTYRGAEIINGDRAAVRLVDGMLMAEGIPFAGSSQYCKNRSLPIEAIVYLGQAPKTTIRKLRGYEAFSKLWEGVSVNTWDKEDLERVSAVVQKVAAEIPIYHLPCTPDESAVIALEEALRKLVKP